MNKSSSLFIILVALIGILAISAVMITDMAILSVAYLVTAITALLILLGYIFFAKKKDIWYLVLFCSVFCVNSGYFMLSISQTLDFALWTNRLSYLGSVFLPMSLTMIIFNATKHKVPKWFLSVAVILGIAVFAIAATPGLCGIYYKACELVTENGVSFLEKVYGPLHIVYYFYLLLYFAFMICAVIRSYFKNKDASVTQVVMISLSAFVNIIVWLIEQFMDNEFEILSVSYVICELFLIGLYAIANENARLKELSNTEKKKPVSIEIDSATVDLFNRGIEKLTNTERTIFDCYVSGRSSKDVMATLFITENTLKFHNKNIYGKLCVPSRKKLIEIYQYINKK